MALFLFFVDGFDEHGGNGRYAHANVRDFVAPERSESWPQSRNNVAEEKDESREYQASPHDMLGTLEYRLDLRMKSHCQFLY